LTPAFHFFNQESRMATLIKGQIDYDASAATVMSQQAQRRLAASEILIDSDALLEIAAADLQGVKALQHQVEEQRTAITGPLNQALRAINDLFRAPKTYLEQAEGNLKAAILRYAALRDAQLAQARAEAEQASGVERQQLMAQHSDWWSRAEEAERAASVAQSQAQVARRHGQHLAAQEADRAAQGYLAAAERARREAAALSQAAAVTTCAAQAAPLRPPPGIRARVTYVAVVTDLPALVQAVAQGRAPAGCLQADQRFLSAHARAARRIGALYPGVEVQAERGLAAARDDQAAPV
jgi:hypothetical protein